MMSLVTRLVIGTPLIAITSIILGLVFKGFDRKLHARMQWRVGPPLKQPFLDVRKLLTKQNFVPENSIKWIYNLMPVFALAEAILILLFIPMGDFSPLLEGYGDLVLVLYLLAGPALFMAIGGFASGSPYATIGSQREMVTMMSYEFPLGVTIATVAWVINQSPVSGAAFSLETIAANPIWSLVNPLGGVGLLLLLIVLLAVTPAELSKVPFDVPEAETEISGGLLSEYTGRNLAMFYLADGVKTIAMTALIVAIFFPYKLSPVLGASGISGTILNMIFFLVKLFLVMFVSVTFVRTAIARFKIDQVSRTFWYPITVLSLGGLILVTLAGGVL